MVRQVLATSARVERIAVGFSILRSCDLVNPMRPHFFAERFCLPAGAGCCGAWGASGQALWDLEALEALIARVQVSWS